MSSLLARLSYAAIGIVLLLVMSPACNGTPVTPTSDCSDTDACSPGFICEEAECRRLCNADADCPSATQACDEGVCHEVINPECRADDECTAPRECELGPDAFCLGGRCNYVAKALGISCDDVDPCTSQDECNGAGRCAGVPKQCTTPPGGACTPDDSTFIAFAAVGECTAPQGDCVYEPIAVSCSNCTATCLAACAALACENSTSECLVNGVCVYTTSPYCAYAPAVDLTRCAPPGAPAGSLAGYCSAGDCVECTLDAQCDTPPGGADPVCFDAACTVQNCVYTVDPNQVCATAICVQGSLTVERLCGSAGTCPAPAVPTVSCGAYVCNSTGDDCLSSCQLPQDCSGTLTCLPSGSCEARRADGDACQTDSECVSGHCECGDPTCDPANTNCSPDPCPPCTYSTDATSPCLGGAAPISKGFDDADDSCGPTTCNGAAACHLPDGVPCNADGDCESDNCTCADSTCSVRHCSIDACPLCTFTTATDPADSCALNNADIAAGSDDALDSCGIGTCDGFGGCGLADGATCAAGQDCQSGFCECTEATCAGATRRCSPDQCTTCTFTSDPNAACGLAPGFVAPGFPDASQSCATDQCNGRGGCLGIVNVVESYNVGDTAGFDYYARLGGFIPGSTPRVMFHLNNSTASNEARYGQISLDPTTHIGSLDWDVPASHNNVQVTQLSGQNALRSRRIWGVWDGLVAGYEFGAAGLVETTDTSHGITYYVAAFRIHDTRGLGWSSTNLQSIRIFDYSGGTTITPSNELTFGDVYTRSNGQSIVNWDGDVVIHYKLYGTPPNGRPSGSLGLYIWDGTSGSGLVPYQHDDIVPNGMSTTASYGRLIRTSYGAMLVDVETLNTWRITRSGTSLSMAETGSWPSPAVDLMNVDWRFGGARGPYVGKQVGSDRWLTTYRTTSGMSGTTESINTAYVDLSDFQNPTVTPVRTNLLSYDTTQWTLATLALMPPGTDDLLVLLNVSGGGRSARLVYIENAL